MTTEERNTILEAVDILKALGGQNGFSNLQPKMKHLLLKYANELQKIAERDTRINNSMQVEEFNGEIVYE